MSPRTCDMLVAVLLGTACVPTFAAGTKWQAFTVLAALTAMAWAVSRNDPKFWLFLAGVLSAFNVNAYVGADNAGNGGLALFALDVPLVALAATRLARTAVRPGFDVGRRAVSAVALWMGALFCAWALLGAAVSNRPLESIAAVVGYARAFLALAILSSWMKDRAAAAWAVAGLTVALVVQSAIAIAQFVLGTSFDLYEKFYEESAAGVLTRSGGTLNPTVLSEFIAVVAPVVLSLAFGARSRGAVSILLAVYVAATGAAVLTLSRGGLASLALSTLIVVIVSAFRAGISAGRKLAVGAGTLVALLALATSFSGSLAARLAVSEVGTEQGRFAQILQAIDMIGANPVVGVGLGNYTEAMGSYGPSLPYPVHNKYLLVTAETGIVGGIFYVAMWVVILRVLAREARRGRARDRSLLIGATAAIAGVLVNMNTDVFAHGGAPEFALFMVAALALGRADAERTP